MTRLAPYIVAASIVFAVAFVLPAVALTAGSEGVLKLRIQTTGTPGQTLTLDLQRWSTEEERAPLVSALSTPPAADGAGRGPGGRGGTGAPARSAGGRGPAAAAAPAPSPTEGQSGTGRQGATAASSDSAAAPAAAAPAAAIGRGATGRGAAAGARGGRGRGAAASVSPEARLAAAVKAAPTLGYLWGSGVTGYSVKYAWRSSASNRTGRLILITDRRLDVPAAPAASAAPAVAPGDTAADCTVIEIRFDAKGTGEGKTSATNTAFVDQTAGTVAVQNYDAIPPQLRITP